MFRNILVAIDGSRHAARALAEAIDLAERNNARLAIMTCVPDPSSWLLSGGAYGGGANYAALKEETDHEYQNLLEKAIAAVPREIPVTKRLVHGRPGDRILEQMRQGNHDLVVMGSRGRGNVRSIVLGSVSHQVLNAGPAAVLIVHTELEGSLGAEERDTHRAAPSP